MKRRSFITAFGGAAAWPLMVHEPVLGTSRQAELDGLTVASGAERSYTEGVICDR